MKTVCKVNTCYACMACVNICPTSAIVMENDEEAANAVIVTSKCINCHLCEKVCPNIAVRPMIEPIYYKQGWANDEIRKNSSSGGLATAIINRFIEDGGYVASCICDNGKFCFDVTNDINIAKRFAGSKYVKSDPSGIYTRISHLLAEGEKVLFVGLPCQSAAVQNYCDKYEKLFTVDLICHGAPSPKLLKKYLCENGINWDEVKEVRFREKKNSTISKDEIRITPKRVVDNYTLAYLNNIDLSEGCYTCKFASINRVSDITLGDAWGQLSEEEADGASVVFCQTKAGLRLLECLDVHLYDLDIEKALKFNCQLKHPSAKHPKRAVFYNAIMKGHTFRMAVFMTIPIDYIKQKIKTLLIKLHILKDIDNNNTRYGVIVRCSKKPAPSYKR